MRFTLKYSTTVATFPPNTISQANTFAPSLDTPVPLCGKYRCRITGYEFATTLLHDTRLMKVVSRSLFNPTQVDSILYFIPSSPVRNGTFEQISDRVFTASPWWNVDINNSIDIKVYPCDEMFPGIIHRVAPFTFLLHLEFEHGWSV